MNKTRKKLMNKTKEMNKKKQEKWKKKKRKKNKKRIVFVKLNLKKSSGNQIGFWQRHFSCKNCLFQMTKIFIQQVRNKNIKAKFFPQTKNNKKLRLTFTL